MTDKSVWNGYLGWGKFALAIMLAFVHASFVVVGIYVAINSRLTALEVKMDVLWAAVKRAVERIDSDR